MKRLFTNINTYEFNNDVDYYTSIVEELKKCNWEKLPNNKFLCVCVDWLTLYKMTAIDYRYFEEKNINYRYEIFFSKGVDSQFTWEVNFYENEERQYNDFFIVENDDLGLFKAESEEKDDAAVFSEMLEKMITEFTAEDVIEIIKRDNVDFWNNIVCDVVNNLDADDIDNDALKEEIGKAWAESNTDELKNLFLDNASSYELKEMATDIINDYL